MEKQCTKCKIVKNESDFYVDSKNPNKRRSECKQCTSENTKLKKLNSKFVNHIRKIANKSAKKRRQENHDEYRVKENLYRKNKYHNDQEYKEKQINRSANYKRVQRKNESFRVLDNAKSRPSNFLKSKANKFSFSIGCTVEELKNYLEKRFKPGMTWDNYGKWHIDHIYPLSVAYVEGAEAFSKACHYSNLQPLWAAENIKKSNKTN